MKSSTLKMVRSVSKKCVTLLALLSLCGISFSSMATEAELPVIQGKITDGKLVLTFTGTLEASDDGMQWESMDAVSPYTMEMTGAKKFFRSRGETSKDFTIPLSETVNLDMIWVESGTFLMGSPEGELGRRENETSHEVTLTQGFWMGKYEITQAQYVAVMGKNPSYFIGDSNPAECVSWDDAMAFCAKLTKQEKAAGRLPEGYEYTLPTEAQWEYTCRAGTETALNSGKNLSDISLCPNLDELGWYVYNSVDGTHPVGEKLPNAWGFYDMHGNVWEWCLDGYSSYPSVAVTDPIGQSLGSFRILRGGSWVSYAEYCRSALRYGNTQGTVYNSDGFRIALSAK